MESSVGQAVSVLDFSTGRPVINLQAMNTLLDLVGDRPFALYSINGNKRTGKSFLLNYFLRYLSSGGNGDWMNHTLPTQFKWRGGAERETTGINIWNKPFIKKINGEEVAILLMDTQGSFDDQTTLTQNATVFALSTLFSSVLTFNVMNDIAEDSLQFLQFFSNYAFMAQSESTQNSMDEHFQKLIILIRDFSFCDYEYGYYDNRTMPSGQQKNFKIEKIDEKQSQPPEIRYVHEKVGSSFRDIGVYLMPDPGVEVKRRNSPDKMDPEFRQHVEQFISYMMNPRNLITKAVGGHRVTGKQFKAYVEGWARLFRSNELPEVKTIALTAADTQYMIAKSVAIGFYSSEMKKFILDNSQGVQKDILENKKDNLVIVAKEMFHKIRKMEGHEYAQKFEHEFPDEINALYILHYQMNQTNLNASEMQKQMEDEKKVFEAELKNHQNQLENQDRKHKDDLNEMNKQIQNGEKTMGDMKKMIEEQDLEKTKLRNQMREVEEKYRNVEQQMTTERQNLTQQICALQAQAANQPRRGFWEKTFGRVFEGAMTLFVPKILDKVFVSTKK